MAKRWVSLAQFHRIYSPNMKGQWNIGTSQDAHMLTHRAGWQGWLREGTNNPYGPPEPVEWLITFACYL
jgi:hypothetical protein